MAQQQINLGAAPNDGGGDTLRAAGAKINANFAEVYAAAGSGAAFPGSPANGDRFFRTDRDIEYFYDGTRWLSTQLFTFAANVNGQATTTINWLPVPYQGTYGLWIERFEASTFLSVTPAEWDVVLSWRNAASANTVLATLDGSADTATTWIVKSAVVNAVLDAAARALVINWTEVSGTATLSGGAVLFYRLVG